MYKKRFAKWGFYKNTRQARVVSTTSQSTSKRRSDTPHQSPSKLSNRITQPLIPLTPVLGPLDRVNLTFLINIRTWCCAFFEAVGTSHHTSGGSTQLSLLLPYTNHTAPYDAEQISHSFKLIADLLVRGQGILAGRLARKAFLQVERILLLEGPLFIWNLLEMLHSIVEFKQVRLFEMLLLHLLSLARSHYSDNHSIVQMLRSLWTLCKTYPDGLMQQLPTALEQGWLLNAEIVLGNFNERFLLLYYRLIWDSVLIKLVRDKLRDVDTWFSLVKTKLPMEEIKEGAARIHPVVDFAPDASSALPADYEILKTESLHAIHERLRWESSEPTNRFRILSALTKSRIFNDDEGGDEIDNSNRTAVVHVRDKVPRLHVRTLAYVMKVLMEIDLDNGGDKGVAIKRMKSTIALREYGQGAADPQVIFEMWRLQHLLVEEGRFQEAAETGREAHRRLEQYLEDIP
jgi:hypothetical protein